VELASNIVWVVAAVLALLGTWFAAQRGLVRVSTTAAVTLIFLICILLLPVISMSDDLLMARQAELPPSAQTWRVAWEGASTALELVPLLCACLFLIAALAVGNQPFETIDRMFWPQSAWLTRSQRLRPPPTHAF
jgi:hypothetical protein